MSLLLGAAAFLMSMHILRLGEANVSLSDVLLVGCLVLLAGWGRINRLPFGSLTFMWCAGLSLFLGGLLLGSIVNGDPLRWLNVAAQYIFAFLLLPMVFMSQGRRTLQVAVLAFVLGVTFSQAFAIAASYVLSYSQSVAIFGPGFIIGNGRLGALTGEGNWNGAVAGFALVMLVNCLRQKLIGVVPGVICFAILLWGLVSSASFTGFAAAAAALLVTFAVADVKHFLKIGLPLFLAGGAYIYAGLPLPAIFETRVAAALESGNLDHAGTFTGRSALIKEAWNMSGDTLLVGLGVDRFRVVSSHGAPVHNFPLLTLTEGGVIALIGLVALLVVLWVMAIRAIRLSRDDAAMAIGVLFVFCVFATAIPHMYSRLWIGPVLLTLSVTYTAGSRRQRRHSSVGSPAGAMQRGG